MKYLPWLLTLAIVGFLLLTTDLDAVAAALEGADWLRLVGFMALVTVAAYLIDSATLVVLFGRFVGRMSYGEVLKIKGVSYFFNAVNYSLAAAAMGWIIHRQKKVPFLETFSSLVWFFFVDIIALVVMMTVGLVLGLDGSIADADVAARIPILTAILWGVIAGSLVFWNGGFDFFVLGRLRSWRIFSAFAEVKLAEYPKMVALRVAFIMVYVAMHWLLLPAFGVHIGWADLLIYAPLITFVQVIPATISGLGAVQGMMVALFSAHVTAAAGTPQAVIVAYSTVIGPLMVVMRLLIGYIFVQSVAQDVVPSRAALAKARSEATPGPPTP